MIVVILALCCVAGVGLYFGIVRPLAKPLCSRIPTGREYRATLIHTKR